jgi:hypothetical protein
LCNPMSRRSAASARNAGSPGWRPRPRR